MATFITPVEVTPGSAAAWTDVDVSAYVPVGTTGVILHIVDNAGTGALDYGVRKNGSTDNRITQGGTNFGHTWAVIGVDSSRIFEAYVESTTGIDIYIVGYFGSEAVFFTNAVDKSTGTINSWVGVDISADTGTDTAIGAFVEVITTGSGSGAGIRKNGSTDNRVGSGAQHWWGAIGVDGSEIFAQNITATTVDLFVVGYLKSGAVFNTNAIDRSTATIGLYEDMAALPAGAVGGIYEVLGTTNAHTWALRKNGSTEDVYLANGRRGWAFIEGDTNRVIEQKISNAAVDLYEIGYFTASPYVLTVDNGLLNLSGQALGMPQTVPFTQGLLNLTGQVVDFITPIVFAVDPGLLQTVGQGIILDRGVPVDQGSLVVTPQTIGHALTAILGQSLLQVLGQPIIQAHGTEPAPGQLVLTGQSIALPLSEAIAQGLLTVTGQNVALVFNPNLPVDPAQLVATGQNVDLPLSVPFTRGLLNLLGQSVGLSGQIGVTPSNLLLTGQAITQAQVQAVINGELRLLVQNLVLDRALGIAHANLALAGQGGILGQMVATVQPGLLQLIATGIVIGAELEPRFFRSTVILAPATSAVVFPSFDSVVTIPYDGSLIH